ncbi:MAG: hypothetical protein HQM16_18630 [Deltaproteobacteria bacterium]|nr:hypothetical protein [Deltaproteobacteria bacterium]
MIFIFFTSSPAFSAAKSVCGNNKIESSEKCDGTNLGGKACKDIGFGGGTLKCSKDCQFDAGKCVQNTDKAKVDKATATKKKADDVAVAKKEVVKTGVIASIMQAATNAVQKAKDLIGINKNNPDYKKNLNILYTGLSNNNSGSGTPRTPARDVDVSCRYQCSGTSGNEGASPSDIDCKQIVAEKNMQTCNYPPSDDSELLDSLSCSLEQINPDSLSDCQSSCSASFCSTAQDSYSACSNNALKIYQCSMGPCPTSTDNNPCNSYTIGGSSMRLACDQRYDLLLETQQWLDCVNQCESRFYFNINCNRETYSQCHTACLNADSADDEPEETPATRSYVLDSAYQLIAAVLAKAPTTPAPLPTDPENCDQECRNIHGPVNSCNPLAYLFVHEGVPTISDCLARDSRSVRESCLAVILDAEGADVTGRCVGGCHGSGPETCSMNGYGQIWTMMTTFKSCYDAAANHYDRNYCFHDLNLSCDDFHNGARVDECVRDAFGGLGAFYWFYTEQYERCRVARNCEGECREAAGEINLVSPDRQRAVELKNKAIAAIATIVSTPPGYTAVSRAQANSAFDKCRDEFTASDLLRNRIRALRDETSSDECRFGLLDDLVNQYTAKTTHTIELCQTAIDKVRSIATAWADYGNSREPAIANASRTRAIRAKKGEAEDVLAELRAATAGSSGTSTSVIPLSSGKLGLFAGGAVSYDDYTVIPLSSGKLGLFAGGAVSYDDYKKLDVQTNKEAKKLEYEYGIGKMNEAFTGYDTRLARYRTCVTNARNAASADIPNASVAKSAIDEALGKGASFAADLQKAEDAYKVLELWQPLFAVDKVQMPILDLLINDLNQVNRDAPESEPPADDLLFSLIKQLQTLLIQDAYAGVTDECDEYYDTPLSEGLIRSSNTLWLSSPSYQWQNLGDVPWIASKDRTNAKSKVFCFSAIPEWYSMAKAYQGEMQAINQLLRFRLQRLKQSQFYIQAPEDSALKFAVKSLEPLANRFDEFISGTSIINYTEDRFGFDSVSLAEGGQTGVKFVTAAALREAYRFPAVYTETRIPQLLLVVLEHEIYHFMQNYHHNEIGLVPQRNLIMETEAYLTMALSAFLGLPYGSHPVQFAFSNTLLTRAPFSDALSVMVTYSRPPFSLYEAYGNMEEAFENNVCELGLAECEAHIYPKSLKAFVEGTPEITACLRDINKEGIDPLIYIMTAIDECASITDVAKYCGGDFKNKCMIRSRVKWDMAPEDLFVRDTQYLMDEGLLRPLVEESILRGD